MRPPARPRFEGPARRRAVRILEENVGLFRRAGYRDVESRGPLEARLAAPGRNPLCLRMAPEGRVFGGTYGLEISSAEPVVGRSAGVTARGRGVVRMRGVSFRARRGDRAGQQLASRLESDSRLVDRLATVHFERIRIEPDGRAVIRHMGGSLVWILFPPLIKGIPLIPDQVRAVIAALDAFADASRPAA